MSNNTPFTSSSPVYINGDNVSSDVVVTMPSPSPGSTSSSASSVTHSPSLNTKNKEKEKDKDKDKEKEKEKDKDAKDKDKEKDKGSINQSGSVIKSSQGVQRSRSSSGDSHKITESSDKLKKSHFHPIQLISGIIRSSNGGDHETPIVTKTLATRMKSEPHIKRFKLPSTETLINDFSAALSKQILLHGRLYLFTNYLCFESNIFGIKSTEIIALKDITSIQKKKFPIGVSILLQNGNKHIFASFISRDKAFQEILTVLREATGQSHEDVSSHGDDDSSSSNVFDFVDESDMQQKLANGVGGGLVNETNFTNEQEDSGAINQQQQQHQPKCPDVAVVEVMASTTPPQQHNNIHDKQEILPPSTSTSTPLHPDVVVAPSPATVVVLPVPVVVKETNPFDELYGNTEQYLSTAEQTSMLESNVSEFNELLSDSFNISVVNFFKAFYSDQCNFAQLYHQKRGDTSIVVKNWSQRERFGTVRELEYIAPVNSPIGPDKTRIQETQRYHLTSNKLLVETDTIMMDIPYGDHFRIEAKWDVTQTSESTCNLKISLCVRFIKKTWFKSKIDSTTSKESKASFVQWIQIAKQEILKTMSMKTAAAPAQTIVAPLTKPSTSSSSLSTLSMSSRTNDTSNNTNIPVPSSLGVESPKPNVTNATARRHLRSSSVAVNNSNASLNQYINNNNPASPANTNANSPSTSSNELTSTTPPRTPRQTERHNTHNTSTSNLATSLSSSKVNNNNDSTTLSTSTTTSTTSTTTATFKLEIYSKYGRVKLSGIPLLSFILLAIGLYLYLLLNIVGLNSRIETINMLLSNALIK
ncbi:hypothetical protein SAMD00019534_001460 [Acytostelium subglobosum LB1]|uniref:hypothetical protein n=1 Tax=Acytostelium subglobosum LB1 TaxID=1410327 RepID=UPI00064492D8|nr:hypothetical protein SAMD00019534_001460 [Acytostelium subglobosum LB1]GAM16971.1 hypothetical protein SAMD00019534_001460 [Acytostelium subglobosum LB1]|eukprot:XP_012759033.1 hypothetical protein SAMD00019534_001460 [Acytostelium subglobosum LB1]